VFDRAADALTPLLAAPAAVSHPQAYFLLGVAHEARGRLVEAAGALEQAVVNGDRRPDVLRALARARFRLGHSDEARVLYEQALAKQPLLAGIRAEYADVLHADGDLDGAIREYRRALVEQPSLATASFNLGVALLAAGRTGEATAPLLESVGLEPQYGVALEALFRVRASERKVQSLSGLTSPVSAVRTPRAPDAFAVRAGDGTRVRFTHTKPDGFVLVYAPDGALLLAVPTNAGGAVAWDVRAGDGRVVPPGLYRAELQWRGQPSPAPATWFALVGER
jgi:tetratricopeptide (TPR) repeat protein